MSGHSKWATIKHKKGAADAKRGKVFSKLAKEIMVVAKQGGGDPTQNITLRTLIQKAKASNMPNDNITRAIKKGTGEGKDAVTFEEIVYEGYAAGGVALIVAVLTDNKNRAAAEIRHIFTKNNSSFSQQGSVSRSFERKGQIIVAVGADEDLVMETALEAGAEDVKQEDDQFEVLTDPQCFSDVCEALEAAGIETDAAEVTLLSDLMVPVSDVSVGKAVMRFVTALEDNDDVQDVYHNMDMDDSIIEAVAAELD
jgi:YebC/PmpR family DNA-binding regulatory protein